MYTVQHNGFSCESIFSLQAPVRKHMCFRRQFFTLIELLVVIAIIAILAAILLPALQKARMQGIMASCQTQMKSLSHSEHMYSEDFNGYILPTQISRTEKLGQIWPQLLFELKYDTLCRRMTKTATPGWVGATPLCPGDPPEKSFISGNSATSTWDLWKADGNLVYNNGGYGRGRSLGYWTANDGYEFQLKKMTHVRTPSAKYSFFDAANAIVAEKYIYKYWNNGFCTSPTNNIIFWAAHHRKINAAALDGHIDIIHHRIDSKAAIEDYWNKHFNLETPL